MQFLSRKHFELIKGLAIVAVFVSHIGNNSGLTWFTPLGGIGVALFLFCSGYGLACSYAVSGLKSYWQKRIVGVYITYFAIELIAALVFQRSFKTVVLDLLLINPAYSYGWYMQYLFGCYFVFWLVFKFVRQEKARLLTLCSLSIVSFFVFENLRAEQAFSFVGGVLLASLTNKKEIDFKYGKQIAFVLLLFSAALLAVKQLPIIRQQNPYVVTLLNLLLKSFAAASIIYLTYAVKVINKISEKLFPFWGRIAYVFYLLHGYLIFIVSDNLTGNYLINSVVFIAVSTVISVIINFVIEKMKGTLIKALQIK